MRKETYEKFTLMSNFALNSETGNYGIKAPDCRDAERRRRSTLATRGLRRNKMETEVFTYSIETDRSGSSPRPRHVA